MRFSKTVVEFGLIIGLAWKETLNAGLCENEWQDRSICCFEFSRLLLMMLRVFSDSSGLNGYSCGFIKRTKYTEGIKCNFLILNVTTQTRLQILVKPHIRNSVCGS